MTDDRGQRLKAALEAARRAGNPTLVASIEAAIKGETFDPLAGLQIHPEARELLDWD